MFRIVLGLAAFQILFGQETHLSVEDLERQWKQYTSFQKHELISFCGFLFDEGHYERAVLACFRFIFLYPEDERIPAVYYRIARSYEESGNRELATEYFRQVQSEVEPNSTEYLFARYRITHLNLVAGQFERVYAEAEGSSDPYMQLFAGYAKFSELSWQEARNYFSRAQRTFGSGRRAAILARLVEACDRSAEVPRRNPTRTALFGLFPGGGRVYLEEWFAGLGTLVTTFGLGIDVLGRPASAVAAWIPPVALAGVYAASILGSVRDVEFANRQRQLRYVRRVQSVLGPERFLDFPEDRFFSLE